MTSPCPISCKTRNFGNWTTISGIFSHFFLLRMSRNGQNFTADRIFNTKFEIPMGFDLIDYEFWCRLLQDLCVFWAKNGFCNAKFSEFRGLWGWGWPFFDETPTGTSLPNFKRFKPWCVRIRSRVYPLGEPTKKVTLQSHREVIFLPICGEFPTQPNLPKIGIGIGVADVINHTKFGNDRSRDYKVTEGQISACSI